MKIWSTAIKDSGGNALAGTEFTLQGEEHEGDLYEEGEEFGYYARGSNVSVALYQAGSTGTLIGSSAGTLYKGNGGYITGRGDSVSVTKQGIKYGGTLYFKSGDTYYTVSSTLYYAGTTETYYKGNGSSGYLRGTSVTDAYYKGNTVSLQGAEYENTVFLSGGYKTVTLQGEKISKKLYEEGQAATLSPAEVTTQSVTALTT